MCNSLSIVTATTISLVGGTVNTTARTARGVIVIATIAIGGITVGMTVADTGMVIVATVSIAVGTGATATATTTLRPSLNSSFDNNTKP
jgi:thiamine monophosphate synthase